MSERTRIEHTEGATDDEQMGKSAAFVMEILQGRCKCRQTDGQTGGEVPSNSDWELLFAHSTRRPAK